MANVQAWLDMCHEQYRVDEQMRIDYLFAAATYRPEEHIVERPRHLIPEIWQSIKRRVTA